MLLECRFLERLRKRYLPPELLLSRSYQNCIEMLNSDSARTLNRLGDFLTKAFKLRETGVDGGNQRPP